MGTRTRLVDPGDPPCKVHIRAARATAITPPRSAVSVYPDRFHAPHPFRIHAPLQFHIHALSSTSTIYYTCPLVLYLYLLDCVLWLSSHVHKSWPLVLRIHLSPVVLESPRLPTTRERRSEYRTRPNLVYCNPINDLINIDLPSKSAPYLDSSLVLKWAWRTLEGLINQGKALRTRPSMRHEALRTEAHDPQ